MKRLKLEFYLFGLFIVILIGLGLFIQQNYANNIIVNISENKIIQTNKILSKSIQSELSSLEQIISDTAAFLTLAYNTDEEILQYLTLLSDNNKYFSSIYYGTINNIMINSSGWIPPSDFDLRTRPWYQEAAISKENIVTEAFLNASGDHIIITIAKAIYIENQLVGVVGGDVKIAVLAELLTPSDEVFSDFSFIIDGECFVLYYPDLYGDNITNIKHIHDISYELQTMCEIKTASINYITLDGVYGYLAYEPIEGTNWMVATFITFEEYIQNQSQLIRMFYIILVLALLTFIALFLITRRTILNPIESLSKKITAITIEGNSGERLDENSKNPLNQVTKSINYLIDKVNSLFIQLVKEKQKFTAIIDAIPDIIFILDRNCKIIDIYNNKELLYPKKQLLGKSMEEFIPKKLFKETLKNVELVLSTKTIIEQQYHLEVKDEIRYYEMRYSRISDDQVIAISRNITNRLNQEKELNRQKESFRALFDGTSDSIIVIEDKKIVNCNKATLEMFGYSLKGDVVGKNLWDFCPEKQPNGTSSKQYIEGYFSSIETLEKNRFEFYHQKSSGVVFPVEVMLTIIEYDNHKLIHASMRDVSERKLLQEKLEYLSYHDQLTKLYNRWFFNEESKRLNVKRNLPITVVMGDVNGLKLINDSFGHEYGDELLVKAADAIMKGCREDDIVARLGGDEFALLLPKTDEYQAEAVVKRINKLAKSEKLGSIDVSISFGWETKYDVNTTMSEIYKKAEDRMYKKKLFDSPSMRGNTINAIINTLHEKNKREEEHSRRVSEYCEKLGKALKLSDNLVYELKSVGLLHDIGKIAIDENILNKKGKLTVEEYEEIKKHPDIGYRILSTVNEMSEMANYVLYHHERWDGEGYPRGLYQDESPLQSRIIAIADAYDAMTSLRSYKKPMSKKEAIKELINNKGTQFDAALVDVFIKKVLKEQLK